MPKKLLIVTSEFPPLPGGIGNHSYHLANNLNQLGYQIEVITDQRTKFDIEAQFDQNLNYKIRRISINRGFRILTYFQRILKTFKRFKENEVIIASGKFSLWSIGIISKFRKRRTIAIIHGSEVNFSNKILKSITNFSLRSFDVIVPVSDFTKTLVHSLNLKDVKVIPNGYVVNAIISKEKKRTSGINLITVGSVTDRKGQENVIRAIPKLKGLNNSIHYHMAGTPVELKKLSKIARDLNIEKDITFHGLVTEEKKNQLLQQSDIFVMLSNQTSSGDVEGFGIALIEANHFGIPAIGAQNCGIEDAIKNDHSGILIDSNDHDAFADAVEKIMKNYDYFSLEARKWSQNFTWDKVIQQYKDLIES